MDVCNRCERTFDAAGKFATNVRMRQLAADIHSSVTRIGFELQKELRRIEPEGSRPLISSVMQSIEPDNLESSSRACLEKTLDEYRHAIESRVPAHARAMMRRQYCELTQFYEEMTQSPEAA